MKASKKIIFFGNERLATGINTKAPTLKMLIEDGYEIMAVISSYTEATSRQKQPLEIAQVAEKAKIPLLLPTDPAEIRDDIAAYGAEAAVLVAYGRVIPAELIDIFPKGIINVHPSLLPKYRGPTPVETAILDGVNETGVSLMRLVAKMDTGPIYAQKRMALKDTETKQDLADKLLSAGCSLLKEHLPAIFEGWLTPKPQLDADATYSKLLKKEGGVMDFGQPAEILERQVRAFAGWPKSQAKV
ncbi:methionyl-tRNA formyltransferase, partial [Candidatus Saccharibacteria bacterium]|nr:methionyl-tRNA formyltransferase [Candidatus Saccharibacteria bacterium]